jgi:Kdo2-lipid IVA lauroyltransferase/acyltransferase
MLPGFSFSGKFSLNLSKFCQAKFNVFLFRLVPFWASRWYLFQIGKIYYFFKKQEKALIQATIRHVFGGDLEPFSLRALFKEAFRGIIDHYHEKLFVAYSNFPRLLKFLKNRIKLNGEDELREILAQNRGIILVTGHYGAVEFLPGALAVRGYPVTMICRFQTSRLRESLQKRAEAVGLHLVDAEEGNVFLAAVKALKNGRILITECDEFDEWRPAENQEVTFLKCFLPGDRTLDLLTRRSGAPVVTALMQRNGHKRYTMNLVPVLNAPAEQGTMAQECLQELEASIQASPAHWYQWKKLGQMLDLKPEARHDYQASGPVALELQVQVPV